MHSRRWGLRRRRHTNSMLRSQRQANEEGTLIWKWNYWITGVSVTEAMTGLFYLDLIQSPKASLSITSSKGLAMIVTFPRYRTYCRSHEQLYSNFTSQWSWAYEGKLLRIPHSQVKPFTSLFNIDISSSRSVNQSAKGATPSITHLEKKRTCSIGYCIQHIISNSYYI